MPASCTTRYKEPIKTRRMLSLARKPGMVPVDFDLFGELLYVQVGIHLID